MKERERERKSFQCVNFITIEMHEMWQILFFIKEIKIDGNIST